MLGEPDRRVILSAAKDPSREFEGAHPLSGGVGAEPQPSYFLPLPEEVGRGVGVTPN